MALIIEAPALGRKFTVGAIQRVSIGRSEAARIVIAEDTFLSGLHFVLDWDGKACRLENFGRNGTAVNGAVADQVELKDGDQLRAGNTDFVVHVGRPSNESAGTLLVGGWSLDQIPPGWELLDGLGLRRPGAEPADNIVFTEDDLRDDLTLAGYVDAQRWGAAGHYEQDVVFEPSEIKPDFEVDESISILFRPPLKIEATALQQQTYVRIGERIGIVTLTVFNRDRPYGLPPGLGFRNPAPPPIVPPEDTQVVQQQ